MYLPSTSQVQGAGIFNNALTYTTTVYPNPTLLCYPMPPSIVGFLWNVSAFILNIYVMNRIILQRIAVGAVAGHKPHIYVYIVLKEKKRYAEKIGWLISSIHRSIETSDDPDSRKTKKKKKSQNGDRIIKVPIDRSVHQPIH